MLHQVTLDTGCPFEALRESSGNCALPCPRDADDQDDHRLLRYVFVLADHESILTWDPSRKTGGPDTLFERTLMPRSA
jgi:hypothetical protein